MTQPDVKVQQIADKKALQGLIKPISGTLLLARTLSALSALLAVVPYIALVQIGGVLISAQQMGVAVDASAVNRWLIILLTTFVLRLLIYFGALLIAHFADIKLGHLIRLRMVHRFSQVPLAWFTSTNSGRVRKALQDDIGTVHQLIAHQPVDVTNAIVMPIALGVYAFTLDWRLGLLSVATIPLYLVAMVLTMSGMGGKTVEMDRKLAVVSARMVEFVTGISVVKAFGRTGRAHGAYQKAAEDFHDFYHNWVRPLITSSAMGNSVLAIPLILLINIGGGSLLVANGSVSAADVMATSLIALLIPYGLEVLMSSTWAQQIAGAAASRLDAVLNTPKLPEPTEPQQPQGNRVVFDQVYYSYNAADGAADAIQDISFVLPEGSVTALVGPSGSGKTTCATLLARFDDPQSGQITLGGVPVSQIENLYSHVGFVLQDPQLLSISIRDNIALGRPSATDHQVRGAARAARILDEIEQLPGGFDTVYGQDTGLSGGQAQRIAIARAILVDAPVLVLDEATALTDPESQHEIQQAISDLAADKTVLLIAHRPEVIAGVDQIVLLEEGHLVAKGTHTELMDQPAYARIWTHVPEQMGESK